MKRTQSVRRTISFLLAITLIISWVTPIGPVYAQAAAAVGSTTPHLLITELVPDTSNVNGADGYEFIEVYNNTDKPISFKDYKIIYRYLESESTWAFEPDNVVVQPRDTLLFWIINTYNPHLTVADFNAHFKTNLVENQDIVLIHSGGMANTRMREVVVATNTGHEIVTAFYNEGEQITAPDKGIFYRYPEDGSNKMALTSGGQLPATPGVVDPGQVPSEPLHIVDTTAPVIRNETGASADPAQGVEIIAEAQDDTWVKTLTLMVKTEKSGSFTPFNMKLSRQDSKYHHTIGLLDLIGNAYLDYYFVATDGVHETTSDTYRIDLDGNDASPRLNVAEGSILKGPTLLKASAKHTDPLQLQLTIDGSVVSGTYRALEKPAYFVFEAQGMNGKNAVTSGSEILYMADQAVNDFGSVIAPIDPSKLHEGDNVIAIRAGSSVRPYFEDNPETNLDDYDVRNVRLLLADGTEIRANGYEDPTKLLDIGDNGRFLPVVYFTFPIPSEKLTSLAYPWNTAAAADGDHQIKVSAPDQSQATVRVKVDNTAPEIRTSVEEGKAYKGAFTIEAAAVDPVAGVKTVEVQLDGKRIQTPYGASSATLSPGSHELRIEAEDRVGNRAEKSVRFTTPVETPDEPAVAAPSDGAVGVDLNPALQVRVNDPTGDDMKVTFYKGYKYGAANRDSVRFFTNATDWEPPSVFQPAGETELTEEEASKLLAVDGQYATIDSTTQFPYLRMQVKLDEGVSNDDQIEIVWKGHSLAGRKVTMYAWNHAQGQWTDAASFVPSTEDDFTLRGKVTARDYVRDRKVDVIVQDQIPARGDYDYTFVWMSDTQFYSELYPHIYESQVNWIKDKASEMNIRYVVHTGDLVNEPTAAYQWDRASANMKVLEDANIPYGVLAGNHDVGTTDSDYTTYYKYFGADRFERQPYYGDSYKNNRGHYDLISANGNDYLFLYMGWSIGSEEIAWMNSILAQYPERTAIICLHDYLQPNGTRSETGNTIYQEVVLPNSNVVAVFSGHYTGSALLTDQVDDNGDGQPDRKVYQMLNDYQGFEEGGLGYMKLLHFDTESGNLYVNTYSPYKNDYNYYEPDQYPGKDEVTLTLNLTPKEKRVATDYIEAKLLTNEAIGSVAKVSSGQIAQVHWNGLGELKTYSWYTVAEDAYGGRISSDVWQFTTKDAITAPGGLRAVTVTDTSVELAWPRVTDAGSGPMKYDVWMNGKLHATVTDTVYGSVTEAVYNVTGLAPDTSYSFHIVAKDGKGNTSDPSPVLTVKTQTNLSVVRQAVQDLVASGQLRAPLAAQLQNNLMQAELQYDKGSLRQASKHMEDFLKHLNNKAMEKHISAEGKSLLQQKADALLAVWKAI
ncbi:FIMAH domain-containing protein [Paenibacillus sp. NPDC056579]|uniref:FIMAH domain-containing protein n=1 Tax=Paenibacillus sp. NPDC056579 TaxID=3345871 RepID=UPI0036ABDB09